MEKEILEWDNWFKEIEDQCVDDKIQRLNKLANILVEMGKKEVAENIVWEIVPRMISFLKKKSVLVEVQKILKICTEIGNAKELFLMYIEGIRSIKDDIDVKKHEKKVNIKKQEEEEEEDSYISQMRILYECLETVLLKIKTKHLSKFIMDYSYAFISSIYVLYKYKINNKELYDIVIKFAKQRVLGLSQLSNDYDEEKDKQRKILHSFIIRIFELFFKEKSNQWSLRYYRQINPYKISFQKNEYDIDFDGMVNSLKNIAVDTNFNFTISWKLGKILETKGNSIEYQSISLFSSNSIPSYGFLFLLGAYIFEDLYDIQDNTISKFFDHMKTTIISLNRGPIISSLIDTNLFLGLCILNNLQNISTINQEDFLEYTKVLSLISSSLEDSSLRFLSYTLIYQSLIRHSQDTTIMYINDILDTSPFKNVKTVVINILKDEIQRHWDDSSSPFISSVYNSLLIKIFRPNSSNQFNCIETFLQNFNFIMQALNLYIFLLKKPGDDKTGTKSKTNILETKKYWIDPLMYITIYTITQLTQLGSLSHSKEGLNSEILNKLFLLKYTLDQIQEITKHLLISKSTG
ncbi:hypothetical protein T552_00865 [Pneumocystis carinii B80]|uniref:Uncharacterized protein n=1 Tax=Pneumocystis carinii (strain B80) TaxID=1408658 RepID=A0A0W4ZMQ5_PNEC8|nr:hypothetical protein T552_00865 [Pneumocystis carinii B80]KTW29656.1 hypothetical protein T552_00865 [Pneumocystis carinii B80]